MRRLHHFSAFVALALLLLALSATWFVIKLPQGPTLQVSGLEVSAIAATLLGAAFAAYAAALLVKGVLRRVLGVLQGVLALGALWAFVVAGEAPEKSVIAEISSLTGIAGPNALEGVSVVAQSVFIAIGFVGVGLGALSGFLGVFVADSPRRQSRYERSSGSSDANDPVSTWDSLSEGSDPTKR